MKKIIIIGSGVGLLAMMYFVLAVFVLPENDNNFGLYQQALDNNVVATCTFPGGDDSEITKTTYYFGTNESLKVVSEIDEAVDDLSAWTAHTLLSDGFVYIWESGSDEGTVYELNITVRQYLDDGIEEEVLQKAFEETGVDCRHGAPEHIFEVPESIIFTEDL